MERKLLSEAAAHGHDLPPADRRLLRGRPPAAALDWAARQVGRGARVTATRAMAGGTSSAVHALSVQAPNGARHRLVLRRFVRADWLADEPDLAEHEAMVLDLLAAADIAAPRLVGVDPDGSQCDVPAVLMSRLRGRTHWSTDDIDSYFRRLAEPLQSVHAVRTQGLAAVRPFRPYHVDDDLRPPPWSTDDRRWRQAIDVHQGPPPPTDGAVLVHRDYHPGNVLWVRSRVTGVVDWATASLGSADADVGHCRVNLAGHLVPDAADRFLDAYQVVSGRSGYHPYWDIVAAVGMLGEPSAEVDPAAEAFLFEALSHL